MRAGLCPFSCHRRVTGTAQSASVPGDAWAKPNAFWDEKEMEMASMGFRQRGEVTPLFGAGQGKAAAELPGSLCPAPPWLKAPVTFEM